MTTRYASQNKNKCLCYSLKDLQKMTLATSFTKRLVYNLPCQYTGERRCYWIFYSSVLFFVKGKKIGSKMFLKWKERKTKCRIGSGTFTRNLLDYKFHKNSTRASKVSRLKFRPPEHCNEEHRNKYYPKLSKRFSNKVLKTHKVINCQVSITFHCTSKKN